jgi:molecular chaperone DnaK
VDAEIRQIRHAIGIEVSNGGFVPLVERGSRVPLRFSHLFTTAEPGQPSIQVTLVRDDNDVPQLRTRLVHFEITGFKPGLPGDPRVQLTIGLDGEGNTRVTAKDLKTDEDLWIREL